MVHVLLDVVVQDLSSSSARHSIFLKHHRAIMQLESPYKEILLPSTRYLRLTALVCPESYHGKENNGVDLCEASTASTRLPQMREKSCRANAFLDPDSFKGHLILTPSQIDTDSNLRMNEMTLTFPFKILLSPMIGRFSASTPFSGSNASSPLGPRAP
jgi:hypothetical protein